MRTIHSCLLLRSALCRLLDADVGTAVSLSENSKQLRQAPSEFSRLFSGVSMKGGKPKVIGSTPWRSEEQSELQQTPRYDVSNYPNPLAPSAYIDFRRLDSVRAILEALGSVQNYIQMRQIVAAFARFRSGGMGVSEPVLDSMIDFAERTIGSTRVEDVVGMLLACCRFKQSQRSKFLNNLARLTIDRGYVKEMSMRELGTVIHSCGALIRDAEKRHAARIDKITSRRRQTFPPSGFEEHGEFKSGLGSVEELLDVSIDEISLFREPDREFELRLPSIMRSLSFFGRKDPRLDKVVEKIAENLRRHREISDDQVAAIIFAMANSKSINRTIIDSVSVEVTRPGRLAAYSTTQLVGIIHAFADLNVESKAVWMMMMLEICQPLRLQELTRQQLPVIFKAITQTHLKHEGDHVTAIAEHAFSADRLEEMSTEECIQIVSLLSHMPARIPVEGERLLRKFAKFEGFRKMKPKSWVKFLGGMSRLKFPAHPKVQRLVFCVDKDTSPNAITVDDLFSAIAAGDQ